MTATTCWSRGTEQGAAVGISFACTALSPKSQAHPRQVRLALPRTAPAASRFSVTTVLQDRGQAPLEPHAQRGQQGAGRFLGGDLSYFGVRTAGNCKANLCLIKCQQRCLQHLAAASEARMDSGAGRASKATSL